MSASIRDFDLGAVRRRNAIGTCSLLPSPIPQLHPMLCRDKSMAQVEAEVILQSKHLGRANKIELRRTRSSFNLGLERE